MKKKAPILLITSHRSYLLPIVLNRLIRFTDWHKFELWILGNFIDDSVKKIISSYIKKFPFINFFEQDFNQIAYIQNSLIKKLKRDYYIKLDDDILVTENWTNGFKNLIERHYNDISVGSVVIPINGYGWKIFLEKFNLVKDFYTNFPDIKIFQGCTEPAVWNNEKVVGYVWNKSIQLDKIARKFNESVKVVNDYIVPYRYSIGAISFTHEFWEKMEGWKVERKFLKRRKIFERLLFLEKKLAGIRKIDRHKRLVQILRILLNLHVSQLGVEEEYLFKFSQEKGYKQYVTDENIIFHFSFFPTEQYVVENFLLKLYKNENFETQ